MVSVELVQSGRIRLAASDALQRDGGEHLRSQRLLARVTIDLGRLGRRSEAGGNGRVVGAAAQERTGKDDHPSAQQHALPPIGRPGDGRKPSAMAKAYPPEHAWQAQKTTVFACPQAACHSRNW